MSDATNEPVELGPEASPILDDRQLARLWSYGVAEDTVAGQILFSAGDVAYGLIAIESGVVEIVRSPTADAPQEEIVVRHGPGRFVGELNLLTGQTAFLSARVAAPGRIHRISPQRFRRLMAEDPELSDLLLRAFLARRALLRDSGATRTLEIVGSGMSAAALALRTFAARRQLPHRWFECDSVAGQSLMRVVGVAEADLPVVVTPDRVLRRATPGDLAVLLGLSYHRDSEAPVDLTVIGAGPAGLAAAVYGASEGLATVLLDAVGPGGQAAASARIENYLGFPSGLSGADLTGRAATQALKFGAQLFSPCEITRLDTEGTGLRAILADGTAIDTRAIIVATGARYRALPLDGWDGFVGAGIYFAATELEARLCRGAPVAVVGGANSAGQAALFLASNGCTVSVVIRGTDLSAGMSFYLVDRLLADPRVTVHTGTEVSALAGDGRLERITLSGAGSTGDDQACSGLFCFIGAEPATDWLTGIALDAAGFVLTDVELGPGDLGETWTALGRAPLPFETNVPAIFAAGDVRRGSMKRVAAAVGEGASAVRSVHQAIGARVA